MTDNGRTTDATGKLNSSLSRERELIVIMKVVQKKYKVGLGLAEHLAEPNPTGRTILTIAGSHFCSKIVHLR